MNLFKMGKGWDIKLPTNRIDTGARAEMRNILIMPEGHFAPRNEANLKKLHKYVKRVFKKNMNDKRTKAYRYMVRHDSEFLRQNSCTEP